MGADWHPQCFRCHSCYLPITDAEFSVYEGCPYHQSCYQEEHYPRCGVCKLFIPVNEAGVIEYRVHPYWLQKYCPSHEHDGTPQCCSCERMEPRDSRYVSLDDGRKLCVECLDSAIFSTYEAKLLYLGVQRFYEGLTMTVEQQIPVRLVERQALNEARESDRTGHHHLPETRGLCLSEEHTVTTVMRRPRIWDPYWTPDTYSNPYEIIRLPAEVSAILILYGLPRLLTGSILAHEMMHAWLRLRGFRNLNPDVEEGICQVLAHMWLDYELDPSFDGAVSPSLWSSSSPTFGSPSPRAGRLSEYEMKLGQFFKHQIETDTSAAYGGGFKAGQQAVLKYGLRRTLDYIWNTGRFPC
ncbi:hypothetical protein NMG60_11026143 [Bertholletia excelsa]